MPDYHDLTAIADTLKIVYGEGIANQFPDEQITYNQFPVSDRKPKGLGYQFSIRYARAQGVGARKESAILPEPLAGKYDKSTILPRYAYGSLRMTGPAIEAAKGDIAAFVDGLADSVDDIYESLVNDLNRMSWGDGFGLIATMSAAVTPSTTTPWTVTCDNDLGVMRAVEGMIIDFYAAAGAIDQNVVSQRIVSVDPIAKTITFETLTTDYQAQHPIVAARTYTIAAAAIPTLSQIVRYGAREAAHATTNTPIEITGLDGIYDDGTLLATFQGILVASYPKWQANILANSGVDRELSIDLLLQGVDVMRTAAKKKPGMMRMGLGQRRKYANLLLPDVRFAPAELMGGYEVLTFSAGDGSIKMLIDPMCTPGNIYLEPDGTIMKYEMMPIGWGNLDQQIHQRAGYDEWDQFLRIYTNLGCEQRNSLVKITDLVEPSLYT